MQVTHEMLDSLAENRLSTKRYKHTVAVADCAEKLALKMGADAEKAFVAAMLHDITKEESVQTQLQTISKYGTITENELAGGDKILHQFTGYLYAKNIVGIEDEDILNAIRFHTTGRRKMSLLEQIIFTADTVSEDRTYPEAEELRKLAFENIDECMIEVCRFIISDRLSEGAIIHPYTIDCYNWCLNKEQDNDI